MTWFRQGRGGEFFSGGASPLCLATALLGID